MKSRDPLENPAPLIRRVYAYVAYRIGDGADAEDVTSDVFERALRYRETYDSALGPPLPWLLGIARRCLDDRGRKLQPVMDSEEDDRATDEDLASEAVERLSVSAVVQQLDERSQDLVALRFGADLSARQIGEMLGLKTNAVEVALHRTLARLRSDFEGSDQSDRARATATPDVAN
jgi:RNA polymerase sigma-70 factor (ECF subfamily)